MKKRWSVLVGILFLSAVPLLEGYARRISSESRELPVEAANASSPTPSGIFVSFKLETGLIQGWLTRERWVSSYDIVQQGQTFTLAAKTQVRALDANGQLVTVKASSTWVPIDPGMITVSPGKSGEVRITIQHAGVSRLEVVSEEETLWLYIRATSLDEDTTRVEIFPLCGGHYHEESNDDT